MADMTLMPIPRTVIIEMERISAVQELLTGIYSVLVDGQWITFTPEEAALVKPVIEDYFGEWIEGD